MMTRKNIKDPHLVEWVQCQQISLDSKSNPWEFMSSKNTMDRKYLEKMCLNPELKKIFQPFKNHLARAKYLDLRMNTCKEC